MSSKPWFAWFPADYRAKTAHLSFEQDGAYRRLLDAYYERRAPLPADRNALYRLAGAQDDKERAAVDVIAKEFFTNGDGKLRHSRCDEQIAKEKALHETWSEAGRKGNEKRWGGDSQAITTQSGTRHEGDRIPSPHSNLNLQSNPTTKSKPLARRLKPPPLGIGEGLVIESIPATSGIEFEIRKSFVDELERLYPAVDVPQTLREIRAWNLSNPEKRKTPRGISKHVNRWMEKVQNGT